MKHCDPERAHLSLKTSYECAKLPLDDYRAMYSFNGLEGKGKLNCDLIFPGTKNQIELKLFNCDKCCRTK